MLHNPKNPPRRQIYLLKRIKRENPFKITLICFKRWTDGSALPVGLRGFTSDADEVQKMPTSFNLQPWIVSWLPPSNSMTWRPEFHDSWWSTRHSCADGVQPHTALQTQSLLLLLQLVFPHWHLLLRPTKIQGLRGLDFPQVTHSKKKTHAAIWRKSCHARVMDGDCEVTASQLAYPNSVTHQAIPHTSWGTVFQEDFLP